MVWRFKMGKLTVSSKPRLSTAKYSGLRGIDLSHSPKEVNRRHSPDMLNMISDDGGNPRKRKGWRYMKSYEGERILDMIEVDGLLYVATNKNVYVEKWKRNGFNILENVKTLYGGSTCDFNSIKLFAFDGKCYACGFGHIDASTLTPSKYGLSTLSGLFDGLYPQGYFFCEVDKIIEDFIIGAGYPNHEARIKMNSKTVPDVAISKNLDGTGGKNIGAGVNLLAPYRRVSYLGDDKTTELRLLPKKENEESDGLFKRYLIINVEYLDTDGAWKKAEYTTTKNATKTQGYLANGMLGDTFLESPIIKIKAYKPPVTGQDNIRVTYVSFSDEKGRVDDDGQWISDKNGYYKGFYNENYALLCRDGKIRNYGYANNDRLFGVSGKNKVYFSAVSDATYIPDNSFINVANADSIVNLHRYEDNLVVVTGNTQNESSVYFISGAKLQDGKETFILRSSSVTTGAVAPNTFATLIDDPMFLSSTGLYGISNHYMSTQLAIRNRSVFVNKVLCKEKNLDRAIGVAWNSYYILALPSGKCYVFDGRQTTRDDKNRTNFAYETYVFDNIPVNVFCVSNDMLLFGSGDSICCFSTDYENDGAYRDGAKQGYGVLYDGEPVKAHWTTPVDYDGNETVYKTLQKRGNVLLLDVADSEVGIYFIVDGKGKQLIMTTSSEQTDIHIKKKEKKYRHLQIRLESEDARPFSIISLAKTYSVGNFSK